ncbi:hypothetical protein [Tenacibaculum caenipelagi]|uniref:Uncharacterized protein n=1 Tax=Tenacibaculum caenipelagi TaxID=1325435 RepID=A0A4R6TFP9_9FLAO|nr:hypothetical protein [Tenacibaculum caenipelagi]TDQ25458.1 hypothetical protein DFQ07_1880 [Tenacibaculum caenipelagi]
MEVIGIQASPKRIELVEFIHSLFPSKNLINWKGNFEKTYIFNGFENIENDNLNSDFSCFALQIEPNESEFPTKITLLRTDEKNSEERELFLALKLSEKFNCRTIINGPEKLADHPYLSLIIENGKIFKADDSRTIWGDGNGTEVKIIKEIKIERPDFDSNGELKKPITNNV